jgi:hypothetical protein
MAYMNQEKKAGIKTSLDALLKPLGYKFTLRVRNHSSIDLYIKSGPMDFGTHLKREAPGNFAGSKPSGHIQVNQYWIGEHWNEPAASLLHQINQCMMAAEYYDRSDVQTDHFDTAYYYSINIGEWNNHYEVIA